MGAILALDLGTRTGWAVRMRDGAIASGSESFKPGRFEGGGMRFVRFHRFLDDLAEAVGGIDLIHFEEVRRHLGTDAAHVYGGLMGVLTAWAEVRDVPYQGVAVQDIKKHATGKGNADKAAVIAAMRERGYAPEDDNHADALALLHWAIDREQPERGAA